MVRVLGGLIGMIFDYNNGQVINVRDDFLFLSFYMYTATDQFLQLPIELPSPLPCYTNVGDQILP